MNINSFSKHKFVAGFTLLELLVSMSLGLFLMAGLIQVLLVNREVFKVQENSSRMQEDGRFALTVLNNTVSLTGFREDPTVFIDTAFPSVTTSATPFTKTLADGEVVGGINDDAVNAAIKDGTDAIVIRYLSDGTTFDCLGTVVADGSISVNRFYVDDDETLNCRSDKYDLVTGAISTSTQPLIDNVEDMQIRYGMGSGSTFHDVEAMCYIDASNVTSAGTSDCTVLDFDQVVSVRISLLLHSNDNNLTPDNIAQTYVFNGASVLAGDSRLYRAVTTTIAMRNKVL
ncbi:MAG: PilW family protein [Gammaproteobacteria bacterium]|nr:PilW family protein [Gammaproteobacteria bacterium]